MTDTFAVVPYTGEAIALNAMGDQQLAALLDEIREFTYEHLAGFKRDVQDEILRRMDANAEWTLRTGEWKLTGDSPARTEFDVNELRAALLVAGCSDELLAKAIVPKTEWVVSRSGLNSLRKLPGLAAAIESCERPTTRQRAVRVSRA